MLKIICWTLNAICVCLWHGRGITVTLLMDADDEDSILTFYLPKSTVECVTDDVVMMVHEKRIKLTLSMSDAVTKKAKNGYNIRAFEFTDLK